MHALRQRALLASLRQTASSRGLRQGTACVQGGASDPGDQPPPPVLVVEYCVLCNYRPRFELLRTWLLREFPALDVQEDTKDHRQGAFEVSLHQGHRVVDLWSKIITGEPSNLEATEAVAELVARELRRYLPSSAAAEQAAGMRPGSRS